MKVSNKTLKIASRAVNTNQKVLTTRLGVRHGSADVTAPLIATANGAFSKPVGNTTAESQRTLQHVPAYSLLRSIILGQIFKTPLLYKPGLSLLEKIANSKSVLLDADKNPLIRALVLPLIYRQFCAGRDVAEVKQTIASIKSMGYAGVILCYSGEIMAQKDQTGHHSEVEQASGDEITRREIESWRDGHLATLDAISEGDYIGVKYTGAGPSISHALKSHLPPPQAMLDALHAICRKAQSERKRLWFDAEQQVYHPTIDDWTIDLMRIYNRPDTRSPTSSTREPGALISTTIQAYLKSSRATTTRYLQVAQREGWTLGIKLVRGAYIASDERGRIHDTKADTDASYDGIAGGLIRRQWSELDISHGGDFPKVQLFMAGHNEDSIRKAAGLIVEKAGSQSEDLVDVRFGQLQGMADSVGGELIRMGRDVNVDAAVDGGTGLLQTYKCLTWGSVKECLHYLVRRAVENQGAAERLNAGLAEMKTELKRRVLRI